MARKKLLIAAGGTGGHLFPAQQFAAMLKSDSEILFAGHKIGSSPFFEREGIAFVDIEAHPLKRGFFKAAWRGFRQSCQLLKRFSPDVVLGFGSYHVFPVLLAAAYLRKKIVLFEANCILGKVNRLFAPFAVFTAMQFPLQVKRGVLVPMLPWKEEAAKPLREDAVRSYGLDPNVPTILIFGGSQGAAFFNENAPLAVNGFQAIHLTGPKDEEAVRAEYKRLGIAAAVKSFETNMQTAYAAADIALCRSGAGTISELIRHELPAVLVPYPFAADDHQRKNGLYLTEKVQGARLILQQEADAGRLRNEIQCLLKERQEKKQALRLARAGFEQRISLADVVRKVYP